MPGAGSDTVAAFARDLTEVRQSAGRSVRDVSRETGIPSATLGGYFAGRHLPPVNRPGVLVAVLDACAVPAREHPAWRRRLLGLHGRRRRPTVTRTPYPGLRAFDEGERDLFFGREQLVDTLLAAVERVVGDPVPVVVVVGPSGAGKSSALRAGLLSTLPDGTGLAGTPTQLDRLPPALSSEGLGPAGPVRQVLVVDQLEELWTQADRGESAAAVLDDLFGWATAANGRVLVLGLRADFYGEAMLHPTLAHAMRHEQVLVEPLDAEQTRAAIEGPARTVGLRLEPGLVEVILADVRQDVVGSALPHLAHVLETMWEASDRRALTIQDYRRAGGFEGAIRQSAERALTALPPERHGLAVTILLRMVTSAGQGWTRRLVPVTEVLGLGDGADEVLDHLVEQRLVTVQTDGATLSHESLVGAWPRLRDAVESRRGDLARRDALDREAAGWDQAGRGEDHLLRGSRLAATTEWVTTAAEPLTPVQDDFLAASRRLDDRLRAERRATRRRRGVATAVLGVLVLVTAAAGLVAVRASAQARTERDEAQSRQMAVAAASVRDLDPGLSQQLAVAANQVAQTREGRSAVLDATTSPVISAWSLDGAVLERSATLADGEHLVLSGPEGGLHVVRPRGEEASWEVVGAVHDLGQGGRTPVVNRLVAHPEEPWVLVAGTSTTETSAPQPLLALVDLADPAAPRVTPLDVPDRPTAAAFVDAGRSVVVAEETGALHLLALTPGGGTDGRTVADEVDDLVEGLAAGDDGRVLAAALSSGVVLTWDVVDGELVRSGEHDTGRGLFDIDVAADGSAVAAVGRSGLVHWLQPDEEGTLIQTHAPYASDTNLFSVLIDDEQGLLAAAGWDGSVSMWRFGDEGPQSEAAALVLPVSRPVLDMAVGPERWLFATLGGTTYTWDAVGGVLPRLPGNVFLVDASDEGDVFMTSTGPPDSTLTLWQASDPHAPTRLHTLRAEGEDQSTGAGALSPDASLAAIGTAGGRLLVWDVTGDEPVLVVDTLATPVDPTGPEGVVYELFVPGGGSALALGRDGTVSRVGLEGTERGEVLDQTELGGAVFSGAVRSDGLLAVSDSTGRVTLMDVDDLGTTVATLRPGPNVYGLDFSPEGDRLALSLADDTVRVFDVADPAAPTALGAPLTGPTSIPNSVKFSPDGHRLAVATIGGQAWIYTAAEDGWNATEVLRAGLANLQDVAWSADGSVLVGGALAGRTRLWLTDVEAAAAAVCAGVGEDVTREEWDGLLPGIEYAPPCAGE